MLLKSAEHVDEGQRKGGGDNKVAGAFGEQLQQPRPLAVSCHMPPASALYAPSLVVVIRRAYVKVAPVVVVLVAPPPCHLPPFVYLRLS